MYKRLNGLPFCAISHEIVDIHVCFQEIWTPLFSAISSQNVNFKVEVVCLLIKARANVNFRDEVGDKLHSMCVCMYVAMYICMQRWYSYAFFTAWQTECTPLHYAAYNEVGSAKMTELLINAGAKTNAQNKVCWTGLYLCISCYMHERFRVFLIATRLELLYVTLCTYMCTFRNYPHPYMRQRNSLIYWRPA